MDRGAWWATIHGVAKSRARLSDFCVCVCVCIEVSLGFPDSSFGKESVCNAGDLVRFLGWEDPLEKGKAMHSSILVWRISWTV